MNLWDALTPEAGQQRRRWLNKQAEGLLEYVPPELRPWLGIAAEMNPVTSMERAGSASKRMVAPGLSGWDRMAAAGDMLSNVAGVVAPAVAARAAGVPVANAVEEVLTGYSPMVQPFLVDEAGALKLTRENAPLIGHHNISPKGVAVASDIGGIPMPSLAISRADYPMTNFGDVTLLADPSMVTPSRNVSVWPTDVYTGRQPRGELQFADERAALNALKADPNFGHFKDITRFMDSVSTFDNADEMIKTAQLGLSRGIDPAAFGDLRSYIDEVRTTLGYSVYDDVKAMPGFEAYGGVERVLYPKDMFTASGNRRKPVPYTLGAVMDRMSKDKAYTAGSEGWNYGPGSFRAFVSPPFRSMDEIQAARGQIVPTSEMAPVKDAFSSAYDRVFEEMSAIPGDRYRPMDAPADAMNEIVAGKNPSWFGAVPPELRSEVRALGEQARELPTEYFEAKPRVAYRLGDFPAALVPEGDARSAELLRSAGVRNVLTYGSPEERAALFKRFPELLFSLGAPAAAVGLLGANPDES